MNKTYMTIKTEFGPETWFELTPTPGVPFRAAQEDGFERLRSTLLAEKLAEVWEPSLTSPLRRAANEAAALAWETAYPLLVFPGLFEEKAGEVLARGAAHLEARGAARELMGSL